MAESTPVYEGVIVGQINPQTEIDTTSGTAHDFTGLPAGINRLTLLFHEVSLSGTDSLLVQLGDAGGFETSGYLAEGVSHNGVSGGGIVGSTSGFPIRAAAGTGINTLIMSLARVSGNIWVASFSGKAFAGFASHGGGSKTLSGELTQVRLTRTGSDTFDAGKVNLFYEL